MSKGKRLREYDASYNSGQGGQAVLAKRGGGCASKLIISLVVTVVVIALLIGGGLLIGNYFCKDKLGVSLWTLFEVAGDIRYDKDADQIVTNPYDSGDVDGFYAALNGNLFLNASVNTKETVSDIVGSIISDGGSAGEGLVDLFTGENIDKSKLAQYDGWKNGSDSLSYLTSFTDRQLAAFVNDVFVTALDSVVGELPYGIKLSGGENGEPILRIDQIIIERSVSGGTDEASVLMTLTASIKLHNIVEQVMSSMGVSGMDWLVKWLLPESVYFSVTVDLTDEAYTNDELETPVPDYELNRLGHYECSYKGLNDSEAITMTKMERLLTVIDTVTEKLSGDTATGSFDETVSGLAQVFAKTSDPNEFTFGNMIRLDTVSKNERGGNSFEMDFLGIMMNAMASDMQLTSPDVIILLQTVLVASGETDGILANAPGASVYVDTQTAESGGAKVTPSSYYSDDTDPIGDQDERNTLIDGYSLEFFKELGNAYGVVYQDGDGNDLYTLDDLYGALGLGEETEKSAELKEEIETKVEQKQDESKTNPEIPSPSITITDEMLCAVMYSQMTNFDTLGSYGIKFEKLAIEKKEIDGKEHSFARMYCTFEFDLLVSESGSMIDLISGLIGDGKMLLEIVTDITTDENAEKEKSKIFINGLYGDNNYFNGLTTGYVLDIIRRVSAFDTDAIISEVDGKTSDAISKMQGGSGTKSLLVGIVFEESKTK